MGLAALPMRLTAVAVGRTALPVDRSALAVELGALAVAGLMVREVRLQTSERVLKTGVLGVQQKERLMPADRVIQAL
jgi:hypothetical protein